MGDFVVGVHENDEFAVRMLKREAFAFLHVFAVVINDERAVFPGDFAGRIRRMRVGQDDFQAVLRPGLARDGREAVVQQGPGVQRGHDETDTRRIFQTRRHGMSVA